MRTGKIFICHRRGDAVRPVGKLLQRLRHTYGEEILHYGSHDAVEAKGLCKEGLHAMVEARAVLIMIGPNWASLANLERLHETSGSPDTLHRWLFLALTRHGAGGPEAPMLIPVLLDDASMPDKASLPKDLKALPALTPLKFPGDEEAWPEQYERLLGYLNVSLGIHDSVGTSFLGRLWKPLSLALTQLTRA